MKHDNDIASEPRVHSAGPQPPASVDRRRHAELARELPAGVPRWTPDEGDYR